MNWVQIFLAATQILAKASPDIIAQFHGGAQKSATKVAAALDIVNGMTSNISAGVHPLDGIDVDQIHPAIMEKAGDIQVPNSPEQGPRS